MMRRPKPGWIAIGAAVATTAGAFRLRTRARSLHTLQATTERAELDYAFLTARGVELDDETRQAASARAHRVGLDVLDLIPGDLDVERTLEVLSWTDPGSYRTDLMATSRGPAQALLVSRDVATRAQLAPGGDLDPMELAAAAQKAKLYAPTTSDVAIAPALRARRGDPREDVATARVQFDEAAGPYFGTKTAHCLGLGLGAVWAIRLRNAWLLAPLIAYTLQPLIALRRASWTRWPRRFAQLLRMQRASIQPDTERLNRVEKLREAYEADLAEGLQRFYEPRRDDCPLCGSIGLSVVIAVDDLFQHKPGTFVLERCDDCGHVFQNPCLSTAGLALYYRDFYEGLGKRSWELGRAAEEGFHRERVQTITAARQPRRWLDVGAGYGHFCLVARAMCPDAGFDGLDMGESIEEARSRGWIDRAHRGQLRDLAAGLAGSYDVVSMHHYLEHTREPAAELEAAARVLEPGGLLLVEVPDPDSPLAQLLGRWWLPWFQPQHLHLLSMENLESLLTEQGFTIVATQRGEAHQPRDLAWAVFLVMNRLAPPVDMPWLPRSTALSRFKRHSVFTASIPVLAVASALDHALAPAMKRLDASNTYRVLAQRAT